jgi:SAM-dependent methyltransferase
MPLRRLIRFSTGGHVVVIVDDDVTFRFPTDANEAAKVEREVRFLDEVGPALPLPLPRMTYVGRPIARYPFPSTVHRKLLTSALPSSPLEGDALALPLRDEAFDVLVARSVFIYLEARTAAARECCRVLRPGGRAAIFEPINRHSTSRRWYNSFAAPAFQPAHSQIVALLRQQEQNADWKVMRNFDERDLVRCFVEAGFAGVVLEYRYQASNHHEPELLPGAAFLARTPSYTAAAREILGATANDYLSRLGQVPVRHRQSGTSAAAYITATR